MSKWVIMPYLEQTRPLPHLWTCRSVSMGTLCEEMWRAPACEHRGRNALGPSVHSEAPLVHLDVGRWEERPVNHQTAITDMDYAIDQFHCPPLRVRITHRSTGRPHKGGCGVRQEGEIEEQRSAVTKRCINNLASSIILYRQFSWEMGLGGFVWWSISRTASVV